MNPPDSFMGRIPPLKQNSSRPWGNTPVGHLHCMPSCVSGALGDQGQLELHPPHGEPRASQCHHWIQRSTWNELQNHVHRNFFIIACIIPMVRVGVTAASFYCKNFISHLISSAREVGM